MRGLDVAGGGDKGDSHGPVAQALGESQVVYAICWFHIRNSPWFTNRL